MAGLNKDTPTPQDITVHSASKVLEIAFSDGQTFRLPFELLRVYSPSAESKAMALARKPFRPASGK